MNFPKFPNPSQPNSEKNLGKANKKAGTAVILTIKFIRVDIAEHIPRERSIPFLRNVFEMNASVNIPPDNNIILPEYFVIL
jgi:hypothetical protein